MINSFFQSIVLDSGDEIWLPEPPEDLKTNNSLQFDPNTLRDLDKDFLLDLGLNLRLEEYPSGWKKLSKDVSKHKDRTGWTLLYIGSGAGTLYYERDSGDEVEIPMAPGFFCCFYDYNLHAFKLHSKYCVIMVCSIENPITNNEVLDHHKFLGNFS